MLAVWVVASEKSKQGHTRQEAEQQQQQQQQALFFNDTNPTLFTLPPATHRDKTTQDATPSSTA